MQRRGRTGAHGVPGHNALLAVELVLKTEQDLAQFKEHVQVFNRWSRTIVGYKNVVSLSTKYNEYFLLIQFLSADIADQSYHKTVTRSSGFSKLNGILTYGPVQPGHYCTSSMGGALSYGYLSKKNAESYCKTFKCDIITELSNGKFEIGLTTRMNKCNIETNNIKQQWFKGQN